MRQGACVTIAPEIRAVARAALPLMPTTRLLARGAHGVLDAGDVAGVAHAAMIADAAWPFGAASIAVAADPYRLPFVEGVFDAALIMATLDRGGLRELWRVLAPAGVLVAVVPRRSLLPRRTGVDGTPYSGRGLAQLLDAAMFEPDEWLRVKGVHVVRATKRDGLARIGGNGGTPASARLAAA